MSDRRRQPRNRCPVCDRDNRCGIEAGAASCWCFAESEAATAPGERAPDDAGCLCPSCHVGATPSPCTGFCRLDETTALCVGCHRTGAEIERWTTYAPVDRAAIYRQLPRRGRTS